MPKTSLSSTTKPGSDSLVIDWIDNTQAKIINIPGGVKVVLGNRTPLSSFGSWGGIY